MSIVRGPAPHDNYTVMSNSIINDNTISFKARGILMYLLSKPPGWKVTEEMLARDTKEGITSIGSGCDELIARGYMIRKRVNAGEGKFSWTTTVYGEPQPLMENPRMDNPLSIVSNEVVSNTTCEQPVAEESSPTGVKEPLLPEPVFHQYPVKEEVLVKHTSPGVQLVNKDTQRDYAQHGKKEQPLHAQIVTAYLNALEGLGRVVDRSTFPRYVKVAKTLAQIGYTPEHVHEKTVEMGSQAFWKDKGLPIERVADSLMVLPPQPLKVEQDDWSATLIDDDPFSAMRNKLAKGGSDAK